MSLTELALPERQVLAQQRDRDLGVAHLLDGPVAEPAVGDEQPLCAEPRAEGCRG